MSSTKNNTLVLTSKTHKVSMTKNKKQCPVIALLSKYVLQRFVEQFSTSRAKPI
jgi:hypothetical protein